MYTIAIYTTGPQCMACVKTKKVLNQTGTTYKEIDVHANDGALRYIEDLGYSQAPVCVVEDDMGQKTIGAGSGQAISRNLRPTFHGRRSHKKRRSMGTQPTIQYNACIPEEGKKNP